MRELFVEELAAVTGGGAEPVSLDTTLLCCENFHCCRDLINDTIGDIGL